MKLLEQKSSKNSIRQTIADDCKTFVLSTHVLISWNEALTLRKETANIEGFRNPQIGAIHAALSHWTHSGNIGTIVMPTGTGKTETMLALLIIEQCPKLLVIVPTDALRTQIADKFLNLGILKKLKLLKDSALLPIVGIMKSQFEDETAAQYFLEQCNVVVATASILSRLSPEILTIFSQTFSHVFIDEAHHSEARTWFTIRDAFKSCKVLQFTATPYRDDGKNLKGEIIFSYPLRKAQEEGYFKPINFVAVHEYQPNKADHVIANKAVTQLREDRKKYPNHLLMARVNSTKRADEVVKIYEQFTDFKVVKIHSKLGVIEREAAKKALLDFEAQIIVCVDMLGEGFDLPELKIAAFHDIRKSLPVTLQFVGRFTRSSRDAALGHATLIANLGNIDVSEELDELYARDGDWNALLPIVSYHKTQAEIDFSNFIKGFGDLSLFKINVKGLKPAMSTVIYRNPTGWFPLNYEKGLPEKAKNYETIHHILNRDDKTLIVITAKKQALDWTDSQEIFDLNWNFYLIFWETRHNLLFIHSSDNSSLHQKMADAILGEQASIINGSEGDIFRCLARIDRFKLQNVGLTEHLGKLIRFIMRVGTDVEMALTESQKNRAKKSVIYGTGYEKGSPVSIGCSYKGRIWSRMTTNIQEFTKWCQKIGDKVMDSSIDAEEILRGTLLSKAITERPDVHPFCIDWHESMYKYVATHYSLEIDSVEYPFAELDIELINPSDGNAPLLFGLKNDDGFVASFEIKLFQETNYPQFKIINLYPESKVFIKSGKKSLSAEVFFYENTPTIWFADGSSIEGNSYTELKGNRPPFNKNKIQEWDWTGVNLKSEAQGVYPKKTDSIQYKCIEVLQKGDYDIIFDDDGSREIADIVAFKKMDDKIIVDLFHLKFAQHGKVGADIKDLYEVCGQAQKSVHWQFKSSKEFIEHLLKREIKSKKGFSCSRLEKGTKDDMVDLLNLARQKVPLFFTVYIVQPSLSQNKISEAQLTLLGVTEEFLKERAGIELRVIGNSL